MEGSDRLVCPRCRGNLRQGQDRWECGQCSLSYRGLRGIADLRTAEDVFLDNQADWERALRLNDEYDRRDFRGLLDCYFDLSPEIPADLRQRQIGHILTAPERARQWVTCVGSSADGALLDLGCGTGSFLAAVGAGLCDPWGIDIALRWLVVARKRLEEEGLAHVRLVCGCAERLPFRDRSFSAIVAGDVIEHVGDQGATLAEAHRVLKSGGRVFFASPNRFSLAPEPHVGVWGVGYLPRRWMGGYVRLRRGLDFRAIRTLGYREWRRLLARSPFGTGKIEAPGLPKSDLATFRPLKRAVGRLYNGLVATRPGQAVARRVGPLFHVVCERAPGLPVQRPSPATRRRSTPRAARA